MAGDNMKLPLFHGNMIDDPEQYLFLCEVVWIVRKTTNDDVKKGQLATTLWGHALDWFMKFTQVPRGTVIKNIAPNEEERKKYQVAILHAQ